MKKLRSLPIGTMFRFSYYSPIYVYLGEDLYKRDDRKDIAPFWLPPDYDPDVIPIVI